MWGFFTLLCRVSGLIRDMLFSAFLGATSQMDIFLIAFKTPNFFRKLFAEGAFSAAFVPLYTETMEKKDNKAFAQNMFMIMIIFTVGFVLFLQLVLPYNHWCFSARIFGGQTSRNHHCRPVYFALSNFHVFGCALRRHS